MKSKFAALAAFLICMLPAARIEHAQAVMLFSKKDKQEMERLMESLKQEENPAFQLTDEKSFIEAAHLPAEEEQEKEEADEETTDLSHKEKDLLSRLVHAEAKGESFNAFEPVLNGSIEKKADRESVEAVEEAVDQNKKETDALFFYNPDIASDDWIKTRKVVKRIGNHVFAI